LRPKSSYCTIIFVKAPVEGLVKTRLAKHIGVHAALALYRAFAADIIDTLKKTGSDLRVYYHPQGWEQTIRDWLGNSHPVFPQQGADLGHRMYNALFQSAADGYDRMALVGSDIPVLPESAISETFSALEVHPAVIGPADDGGYYLVGFNKDTLFEAAFTEIPWSTKEVLKITLERFEEVGRSVYMLPHLQDIDTHEDLIHLASLLSGRPEGNCLHTRRVLKTMKMI
jgi:uncharacterized protein